MEKFVILLLAVVGLLAMAAVLSLLLAWPVMWCWNYVMPYLFGLKTLAWGQAWCLMFLASMLFKSSSSSSSEAKK